MEIRALMRNVVELCLVLPLLPTLSSFVLSGR
jgi:hypothetical protein